MAYAGDGESIYNIVPPKQIVVERPPMYRSTHNGTVAPTASTFHPQNMTLPLTSNMEGSSVEKVVPDQKARTMGKVPGSCRNDPNSYMPKKAHSYTVDSLAEVKKAHPELLKPKQLQPRLKGGVPKCTDPPPVHNLVTSKNFIVANAVETILAVPKKMGQTTKDYLNKEDYGKVPKYLSHIKKDIEAEYEYIRQLQQAQEDANQPQVRPMPEEERLDMIDKLKAKWEHVNTEYQGQTHITKLDTMGKMKRKEKHEAELAQIEKDIEKLGKKNLCVDMCY